MEESLHHIEIKKIVVNPFQPRREFDAEELKELAESIKSVGLIHPPVVRTKGEYYELISGERRVRAAQIAGLSHITVLVREGTHSHSAQAALIENLQRVDLSPSDIARALQQLLDQFGFSQEELSRKIGKKRSSISNYLRLLSLPQSILNSLDNRLISFGHAKAILSLSQHEEQLYLHDIIIQEDLSVRKAEQAAEKLSRSSLNRKGKREPTVDCHLKDYMRKLEERLGTKVEISGDIQKGYLKIDYYSLEDLERIGSLLGIF